MYTIVNTEAGFDWLTFIVLLAYFGGLVPWPDN